MPISQPPQFSHTPFAPVDLPREPLLRRFASQVGSAMRVLARGDRKDRDNEGAGGNAEIAEFKKFARLLIDDAQKAPWAKRAEQRDLPKKKRAAEKAPFDHIENWGPRLMRERPDFMARFSDWVLGEADKMGAAQQAKSAAGGFAAKASPTPSPTQLDLEYCARKVTHWAVEAFAQQSETQGLLALSDSVCGLAFYSLSDARDSVESVTKAAFLRFSQSQDVCSSFAGAPWRILKPLLWTEAAVEAEAKRANPTETQATNEDGPHGAAKETAGFGREASSPPLGSPSGVVSVVAADSRQFAKTALPGFFAKAGRVNEKDAQAKFAMKVEMKAEMDRRMIESVKVMRVQAYAMAKSTTKADASIDFKNAWESLLSSNALGGGEKKETSAETMNRSAENLVEVIENLLSRGDSSARMGDFKINFARERAFLNFGERLSRTQRQGEATALWLNERVLAVRADSKRDEPSHSIALVDNNPKITAAAIRTLNRVSAGAPLAAALSVLPVVKARARAANRANNALNSLSANFERDMDECLWAWAERAWTSGFASMAWPDDEGSERAAKAQAEALQIVARHSAARARRQEEREAQSRGVPGFSDAGARATPAAVERPE